MANLLGKLAKVNDNLTINRYDNGWMVEVGGRDDEDDWATAKVLCNTEEDLIETYDVDDFDLDLSYYRDIAGSMRDW